jgi:hypothetical protein
MTSAPDPDATTPNIRQLHIEQRGDQWALCSGDHPAPVHVVSSAASSGRDAVSPTR